MGCSYDDEGSTIVINSYEYNITGLQEDSRYMITVTASNSAGNSGFNTVTKKNMMAGGN